MTVGMTSPAKPRRGAQPATVTIDRLDVEALVADLELVGRWTRHSLVDLARASGGRAQFPVLLNILSALASWRGRLAVALRNPDGTVVLRALSSRPGTWDDPTAGAEPEVSAPARTPSPPARCRRRAPGS